jgi:hypothetical protein
MGAQVHLISGPNYDTLVLSLRLLSTSRYCRSRLNFLVNFHFPFFTGPELEDSDNPIRHGMTVSLNQCVERPPAGAEG